MDKMEQDGTQVSSVGLYNSRILLSPWGRALCFSSKVAKPLSDHKLDGHCCCRTDHPTDSGILDFDTYPEQDPCSTCIYTKKEVRTVNVIINFTIFQHVHCQS
jgi:hypothetical protein